MLFRVHLVHLRFSRNTILEPLLHLHLLFFNQIFIGIPRDSPHKSDFLELELKILKRK